MRWTRFVAGLNLDEPKEFGEGDLGLAGCVQVMEPASLHPTTEETIRRYGGSCAPTAQWPRDTTRENDDPLLRIERSVQKLMKRLKTDTKKGRKGSDGRLGGSSSFQGSSMNQSTSNSEGSAGGSQL